jgi:hypothetical protein
MAKQAVRKRAVLETYKRYQKISIIRLINSRGEIKSLILLRIRNYRKSVGPAPNAGLGTGPYRIFPLNCCFKLPCGFCSCCIDCTVLFLAR